MKRIALAAAAALAIAAPAVGQSPRVRDIPRRPVLWAQADTNSAGAYYSHGMTRLAENPQEAAAAFYWAARLQPGAAADALYGRRVALLLSDRDRLLRYMRGERSTMRHPEVLAIDSLQLRALALDPFLVQKFDRTLLRAWILGEVLEDMRRRNGVDNPALAQYEVDTWLNQTMDPRMRAWSAYSDGRFPQAIEYFEQWLRRARSWQRPGIRADLGRIHFFSGNYAKAVEHFTAGAAEMRKEEDRDLVFVYQSKAMLEHSAGTVYEKMGNVAAAQEAYGRALQEDLSFAAAHRRLGMLAIARGDTATALSELALAVELNPADPELRVQHALMLVLARKAPEGVAELNRAVELEPLYAAPRLLLARLNDASGIADQALEHYRAYLERAARDDAGYAHAQQRVAALDAQLKAAP